MEWTPITDEVKDGRLLLLGNPEHESGPHMGYWWITGNCMVASATPGWITHPTHYVDISEITFK